MSGPGPDHRALTAQRFATQRLTCDPLSTPTDVVRHLLAVQSQDAPLARYSIALRCADPTNAAVMAAISSGELVRTHLLRPTWHYVAREDLRWLLELTGAKIESSMRARHRGLRIDEAVIQRSFAILTDALAGRCFRTRRQLHPLLPETGFEAQGQVVGHLLTIAELRGQICSGPLDDKGGHRYALVAEVIPVSPARDQQDAIRDLTLRFFTGHGPASVDDLNRWCTITRNQATAAIADLGDQLKAIDVQGRQLWCAPQSVVPASRPRKAFLLPTFDEAFLTYPQAHLPRVPGHPRDTNAYTFAEAGGGLAVHDLRDVGTWKRRRSSGASTVELALAESCSKRVAADFRAPIRELESFGA